MGNDDCVFKVEDAEPCAEQRKHPRSPGAAAKTRDRERGCQRATLYSNKENEIEIADLPAHTAQRYCAMTYAGTHSLHSILYAYVT